jgi:hypothetical protein
MSTVFNGLNCHVFRTNIHLSGARFGDVILSQVDQLNGPFILWIQTGFDGAQDNAFIHQRMAAIWEAQETMLRGVAERYHPSGFLAQRATAKGDRVPCNGPN